MVGFIETMRSEENVVESICRVLRKQGSQVAARTDRAWEDPNRRVAARIVSDAEVVNVAQDLAWTFDEPRGCAN